MRCAGSPRSLALPPCSNLRPHGWVRIPPPVSQVRTCPVLRSSIRDLADGRGGGIAPEYEAMPVCGCAENSPRSLALPARSNPRPHGWVLIPPPKSPKCRLGPCFDSQSAIHDLQMVGAAGFEPTASSSRTKRATRLRYAPTSSCSPRWRRAEPRNWQNFQRRASGYFQAASVGGQSDPKDEGVVAGLALGYRKSERVGALLPTHSLRRT